MTVNTCKAARKARLPREYYGLNVLCKAMCPVFALLNVAFLFGLLNEVELWFGGVKLGYRPC